MTTSEQLAGSAADPDLEVGQVVGEYQVEGKLGQGGFGAVFKAVHPLIGKVVAIKVLARKFSVDPEMVTRFIAEARAVNQIRHRNIIDIFSFGQLADGRHYYVMEYLDGEPLDALIEREHQLSLEQALPILRQVARALDAAHAKGIAHRDLKPENVFLARDPDGEGAWAKLLDFGIAKLFAAPEQNKVKTRTGIPIGTPYFMSPEQCRGKDVDHRTDYYAFGIVAYRMLTGVFPIDGDDYMDILMKQINQEPAPASTINGALPTGVDDTIAWLMAKDPAQRPPNLVTAVRAFEGAAEAAGIMVRSTSGWDTATPTTGQKPVTPPRRTVTAQGPTASRSATPQALAQTLPSTTPSLSSTAPSLPSGTPSLLGTAPQPSAKPRATWPYIAGVLGALVLGGVVFLVVHEGRETPPPPPSPPKAAVVTRPPVVVDAQVPAAAAIDASPAPATVAITVDKAPAGSEVVLAGQVLGKAPGPFTLARGTAPVTLTVRKQGFASKSIDVVPDGDRTVDVRLDPVRTHHTTTHDSHDIEDPFK
jgi:serine/threonine-protein kinase